MAQCHEEKVTGYIGICRCCFRPVKNGDGSIVTGRMKRNKRVSVKGIVHNKCLYNLEL